MEVLGVRLPGGLTTYMVAGDKVWEVEILDEESFKLTIVFERFRKGQC